MKRHFSEYLDTFRSLNNKARQYLLIYLIRSCTSGISFYIAIYLAHLQLSAKIIGYEVSALVFGNLLGSFLVSHILNERNAFKISAISLFMQGVCFSVLIISHTPQLLGLSVFILGVFGYFYQVCSSYLITSIAGKDVVSRSKALTVMSVFSNFGLSCGGILVGILPENSMWVLFLASGLMLMLSAYPFVCNWNRSIENIEISTSESHQGNNRNGLLISLITILIAGMIFAQQRIGLSIFLEQNYSSISVGFVIALNSIMIIFVLPLIRSHILKYRSSLTIGIGGIMLGGGMYLLQYIETIYSVVFLCVFWTFGEMILITLTHLNCFEYSKSHSRGRMMGLYKFLYAFGTLGGSILGSHLLTGASLLHIWQLCGILGILILLITLMSATISFGFNRLISSHSL